MPRGARRGGAVSALADLRGNGAAVLMYHWVDERLGERLRYYGVTPAAFRDQMAALARSGRPCLTLDAVREHLEAGTAPPRGAFVLTFDDGYADLESTVLPVLEEHRFPATVFVVTEAVEGGVNRWDLKHGDPGRALLSWEAIRRLDGGQLRFESHSCSHPQLPHLDAATARREIVESKRRLEDELGREVSVFSYPHGVFDRQAEDLVREAGYRCAVTDIRGLNRAGTSPLRMRRVMIAAPDGALGYAFKARTGHDLRSALRGLAGLDTDGA